jgi:hypothetical protein
MRCTSCKAKGGLDARIVYRGESDIAMLGAVQNKGAGWTGLSVRGSFYRSALLSYSTFY